ncbi:MAG: protein-disulfide reductase DsbD domain-containing protein [Lentilitoribacter sp.]
MLYILSMIKVLTSTFILSTSLSAAMMLPISDSFAASSEWQDAEGARVRVVTQSTPDENGVIKAIVEVDLEPGWKTYWREPGSSGIPPLFNFSNSKNVEDVKVHFPVPSLISDETGSYAGYKKSLAFPIDLKTKDARDATHLQADIFLGVCNEICVPISANIDLDLKEFQTSSEQNVLIENARFNLPTQPAKDFNLKQAEYVSDTNSVEFEVTLPAFYPPNMQPEVFIQSPEKWPMSQPKLIKTVDGSVRFKSDIFDQPDANTPLEGPLYVLLKLGQRSVETTIELGTTPICQHKVGTTSC